MKTNENGFTALEVIVALAVLLGFLGGAAALTRPDNFEARNRDSDRRIALAQLYESIHTYKKLTGAFPAGITKDGAQIGSEKGQVNLCGLFVPDFLPDIPVDPLYSSVTAKKSEDTCASKGIAYESGFTVNLTEDGQGIILVAPGSETEPVILSD
jgi:prepilin-type N-terminal cleavage/methylation domain-containing protein